MELVCSDRGETGREALVAVLSALFFAAVRAGSGLFTNGASPESAAPFAPLVAAPVDPPAGLSERNKVALSGVPSINLSKPRMAARAEPPDSQRRKVASRAISSLL